MAGGTAKVSGLTTQEYLTKYPAMSSLAMARMLSKEHPALFYSVEQARKSVNYYRNAQGVKRRDAGPRFPRSLATAQALKDSGFGLPPPRPTKYRPYTLPTEVERWLILADVHIPYHDLAACEAACEFAADRKIDGILLNGDFMDCYAASSFCRDPEEVDWAGEVNDARAFINVLVKRFDPKHIVWKIGNHEYRLDIYFQQHAGDLHMAEFDTFKARMQLDAANIVCVEHGNPIFHHKLTILHGDEFGKSWGNSANPARTAFLKGRACILVSHSHQTSQHHGRDVRDVNLACWSTGCLCDLHPPYRPLAQDWNHGFAILEAGEDWTIRNYRIVDGKVME